MKYSATITYEAEVKTDFGVGCGKGGEGATIVRAASGTRRLISCMTARNLIKRNYAPGLGELRPGALKFTASSPRL